MLWPHTNIGWKFTITLFESEETAIWNILFGVDFGRGNVVFVD